MEAVTQPSTLVVDIDGTIARTTGRERHITGGRRDWDAFYDECPTDVPLTEQLPLQLARLYTHFGEANLLYLTGRAERIRAKTEAWLYEHGFPTPGVHRRVSMVMRANHDRTPAAVYKAGVLMDLPPGIVVIDDEPQVIAMCYAAGVFALQAPGCWNVLGDYLGILGKLPLKR